MYGVLPLRIDMTEGTPPEAVALLAAAGVMGVPTVLFFDSAGNEVQALRLDGFEPGEDFLKRLSALLIDPPR
jgi:thiol:disulfide interchange protein